MSKPFRELRLRHHIVHGKQLKVLPREQISDRVEGVWNLASNQVYRLQHRHYSFIEKRMGLK